MAGSTIYGRKWKKNTPEVVKNSRYKTCDQTHRRSMAQRQAVAEERHKREHQQREQPRRKNYKILHLGSRPP
jgi:hypothetical protein